MKTNTFMLIKRISQFLYVGYAEDVSDIPRLLVEPLHLTIKQTQTNGTPDEEIILDTKARCIFHLPHNCFLVQGSPDDSEAEESVLDVIKHCESNHALFEKTEHGREQAAVKSILRELRDAEVVHPEWPEEAIHAGSIVAEEAGELLRDCVSFDETGEDKLIVNMQLEAVQTGAMAVRFLKNLPHSQKRTIPHKQLRAILNSRISVEGQIDAIRKLVEGNK